MAARFELDRLKARKTRLIKQNEAFRGDLRAEADSLRECAAWVDQGFVFYKAAGRFRKWTSPLFAFRTSKKQNSFSTLLRGYEIGMRVWKNFRNNI